MSILDKLLGRDDDSSQARDARIAEIGAVMSEVFANENMHTRALLDAKQIRAFTRGQIFADRYNSPMMRGVVRFGLEISVSHNGQSRRDMVSLANAVLATETEGGGGTFVKRILGRSS